MVWIIVHLIALFWGGVGALIVTLLIHFFTSSNKIRR